MEENIVLDKLRYPIGKFNKASMDSNQYLERSIFAIETLPVKLQNVVSKLNEAQVNTPYRDGGWTVRQVVHHLPDSHLNAYIRFKWTLTESTPTIKAYREDLWAELPDSKAPVYISFNLLSGLHEKWVTLMRSLTASDWEKSYIHPETQKAVSLIEAVGMYAWHGEHHLSHIRNLIERKGWK